MKAKTILSLTRFFYKKTPIPCYVAGRFFDKDQQSFVLKSQGQWIVCKKNPKFYKTLKIKPTYEDNENGANKSGDKLQISKAKPGFKNSIKPQFLKEGTWIAVELKSKTQDFYNIGRFFVLNAPLVSYKEQDYSYQNKGEILQKWQEFLQAIKDFFTQKGLAYSSSPHLVKCPGTEPYIQPLKSSYKNLYLASSPEMHLKRLLCQDWTDFFEIKTCFRQEPANRTHQVEFSLLEWYRAFYSTKELMRECYQLILFLQKQKFCPVLVKPKAEFVSVKDLFKTYLNFSLSPNSSKEDLQSLIQKEGLIAPEKSNFEDLFFLLFLNKIENKLPKDKLIFVYDYPAPLRAFAQISSNGWADRFELYWKGLELANAFNEVIQAKEQKALFAKHIQTRKDFVPIDKPLLQDMTGGMPPVSGIALGLDRLFMALTGESNIKNCRLFPL